ncbi:MAG: Ig-like domain-containing protein, partial [Aridibacter sp.]
MKKTISWLLFVSVYLSSITPLMQQTHAQILEKTRETRMKDLPDGLKFSLSEATEGAENREKTPPANADKLSENETSNLLKRIPPIKTEDGDKTDFAKRVGSLPAPKTGKKIPVKFPADESNDRPNINNSQTLEVVRFSPEGDVELAPDLSVTFSHPMVAVTSQEGAAATVPVQLSPNTEGKWHWLGTKTLMFDTTKRFRMATKYTAHIPAGTKAATGQVLQKDVFWSFTTPPPKIENNYPSNGTITRRDELMFVAFDQEINPKAVIETIFVTSNGKRIPIRLATDEELKAGSLPYYIKNAEPNRWLAFRAINSNGGTENALPADSSIRVTVNKGTPSAEGPLKTTSDQSFWFKTYGAMKFIDGRCGNPCSPFQTWYLRFTNSIDTKTFDKSMIKISPAV